MLMSDEPADKDGTGMTPNFSLIQPGIRPEQVTTVSHDTRRRNQPNSSPYGRQQMPDPKVFKENPRLFTQQVLERSTDSAGDVKSLVRFAQNQVRYEPVKRSTLVVDDAFGRRGVLAPGLTHGNVVSQLAQSLTTGVNFKEQTNPAMDPKQYEDVPLAPGLNDIKSLLARQIRGQGAHLQKTIEAAGGENVVVNQSLGSSQAVIQQGLTSALGNPLLTVLGVNRQLWRDISPNTAHPLLANMRMMFPGWFGPASKVQADVAMASESVANAPEIAAARRQLYEDYRTIAARYPKAVVVQATGNSGSLPNDRVDQNLLAPANYEQLDNFVMVAAGDNNRDAFRYPGFAVFNSLPSNGPTILADGVLTMPVQFENKSGAIARVPGTSIAAPIVSSTIANAMSLRPDLTAGDLTRLMRQTANDLPGTPQNVQGSGWVDPDRFFEAVRGA